MSEYFSTLEACDVRFPTSRHRHGSDAMNPFPVYSAAYVVLTTSAGRQGCRRPSSACRCARMPAASACARWCSIWRSEALAGVAAATASVPAAVAAPTDGKA